MMFLAAFLGFVNATLLLWLLVDSIVTVGFGGEDGETQDKVMDVCLFVGLGCTLFVCGYIMMSAML